MENSNNIVSNQKNSELFSNDYKTTDFVWA
jgi:hypothetical protein